MSVAAASTSVPVAADGGLRVGETGAQRSVPLYYQIFLTLRQEIISGKYKSGDALPSEHVLSEQFNVSRVTVRKALDRLCAESLLRRVQGSGTYVTKIFAHAPVSAPLSNFAAHSESLANNTTVRLFRLEYVEAPVTVAAMMELEPGSRVQHSHRVRSYEGTPFLLLDTYLPNWVASRFDVVELERASLHLTLRNAGIQFGAADCAITAVAADALKAQLLEVPTSTPLLSEIWVQRDNQNRVVEYNTNYARPDIYVPRMSYRDQDLGLLNATHKLSRPE